MYFLPKKWFFPQNAPAYRALFWLFCLIIQCVFTPKIPKKLFFSQIATIIQGTLLTFLPKSHFSLKMRHAPAYRALFWLFWPITQCLFTTKIPIKLIFPQIAPIVQGTLLTFFPKKVIFPKKCLHIEYDFDFLLNNPLCFYTTNSQKVHFSSNCSYNTGHFIDFFPKKKVIFSSKCPIILSIILSFLPNNPVCFCFYT